MPKEIILFEAAIHETNHHTNLSTWSSGPKPSERPILNYAFDSILDTQHIRRIYNIHGPSNQTDNNPNARIHNATRHYNVMRAAGCRR